jgi:hypothetical protein
MPAKHGPNLLFCMPSRTNYLSLVVVSATPPYKTLAYQPMHWLMKPRTAIESFPIRLSSAAAAAAGSRPSPLPMPKKLSSAITVSWPTVRCDLAFDATLPAGQPVGHPPQVRFGATCNSIHNEAPDTNLCIGLPKTTVNKAKSTFVLFSVSPSA